MYAPYMNTPDLFEDWTFIEPRFRFGSRIMRKRNVLPPLSAEFVDRVFLSTQKRRAERRAAAAAAARRNAIQSRLSGLRASIETKAPPAQQNPTGKPA